MDKFEWTAGDSAPHHYPMEIIRGAFLYHGEANEGLYIPNGGTLKAGWGVSNSNHITGEKLKPLPDRLKIVFFSFVEKQFYQGEFTLPYEKILALFRAGEARNKANGVTYDRLIAGVAPGGAVAVWYMGEQQIEVFFGQAQKVNLDPSSAFNLPFKDEADAEQYMEEGLIEELKPAELESLKQHGIPFGLWSRYRKRYHWIPTSTTMHPLEEIDGSYVNGETFGTWRTLEDAQRNQPQPVPRRITFMAPINGSRYVYEIDFDHHEIMSAFEKLGGNGEPLQLEFDPRFPVANIRIRVSNGKDTIELKKLSINQ